MSLNSQEIVEEEILQIYELVRKLGSGAYGHVWKVKCKNTGQFFALKKIFSAFQNDLDSQRTFRQISLLSKISHPNIAKLIKVIKAKNDMDIYLLFNYMQSDLYKAIKGDYLNEIHKKYIIYQLAKVLKYLHSGGILHRDLKPSNVLINADCKIQLCDFGLSRTTYSYNGETPVITQFIATRWYRAPQVLLGSKHYTNKSDMWSLGCLIYELYAKKPLLPGNDSMDQIEKLLQFKGLPNNQQKQSMNVSQIDKILSHFSVQKKLIGQYFSVIPNIQVKKLLLKLLQYDPNQRLSAQQLLQSQFLYQFRQFQEQPMMENFIKLQQNQNQRLSFQKYRELIYKFFIPSQKQKIDFKKQRQSKQVQKQVEKDIKQSTKSKFYHKKYNSQHIEVRVSKNNTLQQKQIQQQISKQPKQSIKFNIKKHGYHSVHKSNISDVSQSQKNSYNNNIKNNIKLPVFDHINISLNNKQTKKSFLQTIKTNSIIQNKNGQSKLFKINKRQRSFQSFIQKARSDVIHKTQMKITESLKKYILTNGKNINKTNPNTPRTKNQQTKISNMMKQKFRNQVKQNMIHQQQPQKTIENGNMNGLKPLKKKNIKQMPSQFMNYKKNII